ncbi:MAG: hypothetical protein NWF05_03690 [Candidatus Bathyarchaeota archaeon]|nr:hypothetical protein [Candidatus Bathyarchaeota archaeon]
MGEITKKVHLLSILVTCVLVISSSCFVSAQNNGNFVLLQGTHTNLYMPDSGSGVNFTYVLVKYQATNVTDACYDLFAQLVGSVPYSGETILITAEGYDGEENKPTYAGHSGNPITVVYDRLSSRNYILSYTPNDGENSVPNFGLYAHEMWHDFCPSGNTLLTYFNEEIAHLCSDYVPTLVVKNGQNYGLDQLTIDQMSNNNAWAESMPLSLQGNWSSHPQDLRLEAFFLNITNSFKAPNTDGVLQTFFKLAQELPPCGSDADWNSELIALINYATNSDYRSVFSYYAFTMNSSSYQTYLDALNAGLPTPSPTPTPTPTIEEPLSPSPAIPEFSPLMVFLLATMATVAILFYGGHKVKIANR